MPTAPPVPKLVFKKIIAAIIQNLEFIFSQTNNISNPKKIKINFLKNKIKTGT
jgi:hypothetical protein